MVLSDDLRFSEYIAIIYYKKIQNLRFLKRNYSELKDLKCLKSFYTQALLKSVHK